MKSADMAFYNPHQTTAQVLYKEDEYGTVVLPVRKRERGDRWSHGNRTIGCYKRYSLPGTRSRQVTPDNVWEGRWVFEWVDPRQINRTMTEVWAAEAQAAEREAKAKAAAIAKQLEIKRAFKATGLNFQTVMELLDEPERDNYKRRMLLRGDRTSFYVSADMLIKLIKAAQDAVPEVKHARIQSEVEAALALLGEVG